jgi:hypothetical protein
MAKIVYEDALVTEYDDGREEVRFTDEEWAVMMRDPAFGYVFPCGHRRPENSDGTCWECEALMSAAEPFDIEAFHERHGH